MGFPFLTGFYSKDLILEWTFSNFSIKGFFAYWLGSFSAFFTAFYSIRLLALTFLRKPSVMSKQIFTVLHEVPFKMGFPLFFLSFFSIFIGFILKDMFVGMGTDFWGNSIFILPTNFLIFESEFLQTYFKIFPVCLSFLGALFAFFIFNFYIYFKKVFFFKISLIGNYMYNFLNRKWYFDKLYNYFFSQNILNYGYRYSYQNIDRGILEYFGSVGIYKTIFFKSNLVLNFYNKNLLSNFIFKMPFLILFSNFCILIFICVFFYVYWFSALLDIFLMFPSININLIKFNSVHHFFNIFDYPINISNKFLFLFTYAYCFVNSKIVDFFSLSTFIEFGWFSDFFFSSSDNQDFLKDFYNKKLFMDWFGLCGFFYIFGLEDRWITVELQNSSISWLGYIIPTKELLTYYQENFCIATDAYVVEMAKTMLKNASMEALFHVLLDQLEFKNTVSIKLFPEFPLEYLFQSILEDPNKN